ncbi:6-bladed beta-propeller [Puteibacter caeruleilacunae]|nr:6-bladed beta-propeller [Puteibacter caeruleilacunae]
MVAINFEQITSSTTVLLRQCIISLITVISIIIFSCCTIKVKQKEERSEIYTIDVEAAVENKVDVPISEIATEVSYVSLETNKNSLIGKIQNVEITRSYIFVCERKGLYQFTHEGKFIKQIGRVGRGPSEYSSIIHFAVNEDANTIIVQSDNAFIWYDINGRHVKTDRKFKCSTALKFYSPTRLACNRFSDIENPTCLTIWDSNLVPLYNFKSHNPPKKKKLKMSSGPLYVYEDNLYYKEKYNDTLYCVRDSLMIPHVIYNEKNLLLDKDFDLHPGSIKKQFAKVKNKLVNGPIVESNMYVFTSYLSGMFLKPEDLSHTRILFNKSDNKTMALAKAEFVNDIDGGFDFWPSGTFKNGILYRYILPYELKAHVASEAFKNSSPRYPEKKEALQKLANSLSENDNPVLMLVRLRE